MNGFVRRVGGARWSVVQSRSMDNDLEAECKVIRPDELEVEVASGAMTRLAGVSQALVGAEGIHLAFATIPPGCASSPHYHVNCESAIYVLKGKGRFLTGKRLDNSLAIGTGRLHLCAAEFGTSAHQRQPDGANGVDRGTQRAGGNCRRARPLRRVVSFEFGPSEAPRLADVMRYWFTRSSALLK